MNYFKYKFKTIGEFGDPARVTHSLNMPHLMGQESTLVVKDYVAKERESEYSVCSIEGSASEIREFVSSQSEHIGLTKKLVIIVILINNNDITWMILIKNKETLYPHYMVSIFYYDKFKNVNH